MPSHPTYVIPLTPPREKTKGQSTAWLSNAPSTNEGPKMSSGSRTGVAIRPVEYGENVVMWALLSCAGNQAGDVVALQEHEKQHARQHGDRDTGVERTPVDRV